MQQPLTPSLIITNITTTLIEQSCILVSTVQCAAATNYVTNTVVWQYHYVFYVDHRAKQLALGTMMMREHRAKEVMVTLKHTL
jgi:hypothetical protein